MKDKEVKKKKEKNVGEVKKKENKEEQREYFFLHSLPSSLSPCINNPKKEQEKN